MQIVKGIDAVTREQLVRLMSIFGLGNATPVFSMVPSIGPFKPVAFIPTITEEDKVILNNVQKILEFLTAGSTISTSKEVLEVQSAYHIVEELFLSPFSQSISSLFFLFILGGTTGCGCCSSYSRASSDFARHLCYSSS